MNSLSWLIYMAQVLTSLGNLFIGIAFLAFVGVFAGIIMALLVTSYEREKDSFAIINRNGRTTLSWSVPLFVVSVLLGNGLPNKDTLYAIAASQLGERIVQSGEAKELANDAYVALRAWLKKQTETKN